MKQFDVGTIKSTPTKVFSVDKFNGIDLSTTTSAMSPNRSPDAPNMMPDMTGKPIKRTGYEIVSKYPARINGRFLLGEHEIIHSGTNIYVDSVLKYSTAADEKSTAFRSEDKLFIFDGTAVLKCNGTTVEKAETAPYIPTVTISRSPINAQTESGGTAYEPVNLLGRKWTELFIVSEEMSTATQFPLSFDTLDETAVTAKVLTAEGEWADKVENTDFTVDRTTGVVTFLAAPGATPLTGEDNVSITASRDWGDYPSRINSCRCAILYGYNGTTDRIFANSGANKDYWCQINDPTYWGDTWYSQMGQDDVEIVNYSLVGSYLATHIKNGDNGRSVIIRAGKTDTDGNTTFPIQNILQGEEAIASRSFIYMETEPLFITARGVYALTEKEITGKTYTQNRSFFINKKLCEEADLDKAECCKWKQFYVISVGGHLYIVDTSQKDYIPREPNTSFQYECYYWDGIDGRILWEDDGVLCFGDSSGNIAKFHTETESPASYHDDTEIKTDTFTGNGTAKEFTLTNINATVCTATAGGTATSVTYNGSNKVAFSEAPANGAAIVITEHYGKAVEAYWTVPSMYGDSFYHNKTVRYISVSVAPHGITSVLVEFCNKGVWDEVKEFSDKLRFFQWSSLNWKYFNWTGDGTAKTVGTKCKFKKIDKANFRFCNRKIDEPFGIYQVAMEYTENGKYKQ